MEINKKISIRVDKFGEKTPIMEFYPPEYEMLSHLSYGHLSASDNVKNEIQKISDALKRNKEYSFAGDDWCIVDVKGNVCTISNGFDEFEPFEIDTKFIINLLNDWLLFLKQYEKGNI